MRLFYYFLLLFLVSTSFSHSKDKAYFAGGCFWCMEESFEMLEGVEEVISGYSGGITANPTYREVTYGDTGHFEVVEIIYDKEKISYKELLKNFWLNIDPFDAYGQFCDKGYSYRSVAFYENDYQKDLIDKLTIALLSNGHVLLEGVPGLAKTLSISTLSQTIDADFSRIQFTPDMLPSDLLGTLIYNQKTGEFNTKKGPIFSNIILADRN